MSDSIFRTIKKVIHFEKMGKPIYLIPFGDIHRYAPLCHVEKWREFLEWASKKENVYFLGMGDYDDMFSGSERVLIANPNFHESSMESMDDVYDTRVLALCEELKFMKGKVIGLIEGNHYAMYQNATTTTQKMCEILNCPYLGGSCFVRLVLRYLKGNESMAVDIWAHHGKGASRLIGGSLNTVQQMEMNARADIYLMGHDHKKSIGMSSKLELKEAGNAVKLHNRKQLFARTGSFLIGYMDNKRSYVARRNLTPTDLGVVKIEMTPHHYKRKSANGLKEYDQSFVIDIHGSI